jgi:hypothetical protein
VKIQGDTTMTWLLIATWVLPGHATPEHRQYALPSELACRQEIAKLKLEIHLQYYGRAAIEAGAILPEIPVSAECVQR